MIVRKKNPRKEKQFIGQTSKRVQEGLNKQFIDTNTGRSGDLNQ
jgi:hypothetical protein